MSWIFGIYGSFGQADINRVTEITSKPLHVVKKENVFASEFFRNLDTYIVSCGKTYIFSVQVYIYIRKLFFNVICRTIGGSVIDNNYPVIFVIYLRKGG